jgi:hypothetical protein
VNHLQHRTPQQMREQEFRHFKAQLEFGERVAIDRISDAIVRVAGNALDAPNALDVLILAHLSNDDIDNFCWGDKVRASMRHRRDEYRAGLGMTS